VQIRDATPGELAEVGDIRIVAYQAGGFISPDSGYATTLRGLGADGTGHVLVACLPENVACLPENGGQARDDDPRAAGPGDGKRIVGTIMLQTWPNCGPVVAGPDEAEIRALAVRPQVQGQGVGRELLTRLIERASGLGVRHLVLCTEPAMRAAHRLYEQAGFVRLPERDWSPAPEVALLVYGMRLDRGAEGGLSAEGDMSANG
jgi:ribosomal protein S18 acetylase RimI-like enzyme